MSSSSPSPNKLLMSNYQITRNKVAITQRFFNSSSPIRPLADATPAPPSPIIPDFILWVKEEPFLMGVLSSTPSAKIGINVLRKVADYCRAKEGYFPQMSLMSWGHISKYKLQLPIELSWSFLRMFDILMQPLQQDLLPEEGRRFQTVTTAVRSNLLGWDSRCEEIRLSAEDQWDELQLDTLKFLLFLYIQNHNRLHKKFLRRLSPSFDDRWPPSATDSHSGTGGSSSTFSQSPSPTRKPSPRANNFAPKKKIPEQFHLEFVSSNLDDIIDFLCLVIKNEEDEKRMDVKIVRALTLILGAASVSPLDREFKSLEECLIIIPDVAEAVDYDRGKETVDKKKFCGWVKANLKLNPWGPTSAPVPQQEVQARSGIWSKSKSYEQNRIYWNTQLCPKSWYLVSSVNDQVLHLPHLKPFSSVKIHRCSSSYIYIPGAFSSITVEKCHNLTLFLGAVGRVVKFTECSNLQVSAVGRMFILWDVIKSTFNICTPCQPIISGTKNRKITLGPYNTFYPELETDMDKVGLGVVVQKWNKPMELDSHGLPLTKSQIPNYTLMRTEKFSSFIYPFDMDGETEENPVELPRSYQKKLKEMEKSSKAEGFRKEVENMNLNEQERSQINSIVTARFHKWLKAQGHLKELKGLRSMQKSMRENSPVPLPDCNKSIKEEVSARRRSLKDLPGFVRTGSGSGSTTSFLSVGGDSEIYGSGEQSVSISSGVQSPLHNEAGDDDVFVYEGEDFQGLNCIFLSDGEETDVFDDEVEDEGSVSDSGGSGPRGKTLKKRMTSMEDFNLGNISMDDGLLWSPLRGENDLNLY